MISSDNSPQEPNAPIFLEDISITHINGHRLEEPCSGRVVLRLFPTIMPLIESDSLPIEILSHRLEMPFVITLRASRDIQVVLLTPFPVSTNRIFKGTLGLYKSPCIVMKSDAEVKSVSFCVLNFPKFYGQKDKWVDRGNVSLRLGTTELNFGDWRIAITEDPSLSENRKLLAQTRGYAVTHTGLLELCGSETFSVQKAECVLRALRAFLSFARGSGCGLTLVKAIDPDGGKTIMEWGTQHVETWKSGEDTWLPETDGGDVLSQLFPEFWKLCVDPVWDKTLFAVIDWYLNSNNSPFHVGIILVQAALESLCHKIAGPKKGGGPVGGYLSKSIQNIGLCTAIPSSCSNLDVFSRNCCPVRGDGPGAIVELRNDLVHANRKHKSNTEVQIEALRLGQWYIEMILLRKFNYHGRYINRLAPGGESPFKNVPWATSI